MPIGPTEELSKKSLYTYHNDVLEIYSFIDHCFIINIVNDVFVIDDTDVFSDHHPLGISCNHKMYVLKIVISTQKVIL
jgi:hypothetical protein